MSAGYLAIVLHAHLPFVRHPEHRYFLEENWLYEAVTATYLPLIEMWQGLQRDSVPGRMTISISPTLSSMLSDDTLRQRTAAYLERLERLAADERRRTAGDPVFHRLADWYGDRFARLHRLHDAIDGDLVGAFRKLQDDGLIEIITVGATHGFLPVIRQPEARRAQIEVAAESYRRAFGRQPRGIWLPECGYIEGLEELCAGAGLRYFFMDAHGVLNARPRPPLGIYAPIYTRAGAAAFGRDLESSKQVWSATEGYPGDAAYRDFYRDIGFDLPLADIGPYIHPDGIRVHTGFKYYRVTGPRVELADKAPYDPEAARQRAAVHAGNFMFNREKQIEHLAGTMDRKPIIVSPYDAELFGHWWFEGPLFLDALARKIAYDQQVIELGTASDYLAQHPVNAHCQPSPSSWGDGGYSAVWLDESNDWIYRHVHRAEARMHELAVQHRDASDGLRRRALNQAGRELLLAESSDWAFIMKTGSAVRYASDRIKAHLARFRRLDREISAGSIDAAWLADLEWRDSLFPELDYRAWS